MSTADKIAEELPQTLPRATAAMLISVALHLTACLMGVMVWLQHAPAARGLSENARQVEVVLARADTAERSDYFQSAPDAASERRQSRASDNPNDDSLPPAETPPSIQSPLPTLADQRGTALAQADGLFVLEGGRPGPARVLPGLDDAAILAEDAKRRKPGGPAGPSAEMTMFGSAPARGRSFVFVIDRSQSMGSDGLGVLSAAANELAINLRQLSEQQTFQIVAYNQQPTYLGTRRLLPASEENKHKLVTFVKELVAYGATEHYFALSSALQMNPDVIYFMTDGEDPLLTLSQIAELGNRGNRTTIHCIQFGKSADPPPENHFMRKLAEQTRGSYVYVAVSR